MSRSPRVIRSTLAVLAVAGTLLVATPAQGQAAGPPVRAGEAQPADWTEEAFPAGNARLYDAARVDADTTWAVGSRAYGEGRQRYSGPVIFSRDDDSRSWTDVPVPDGYSGTSAVAADPAGNIWVAGSNSPDDKGIPTARRDATGWDVLPEAPVPEGTLSAGFAHLAPVADDDVWAAGYRQPEGILTFDAMIEHWDGTAWRLVELPAIDSDYSTLSDVVALSADDIWAAGDMGTGDGYTRPLLLHYDGHSWTQVAAPALDGIHGGLVALAATGPNDVWAVGEEDLADPRDEHTLAAHFDGKNWTKVATGVDPGRLDSRPGQLVGVTATSAGATVIGYDYVDDGTAWKYVPIAARRAQ